MRSDQQNSAESPDDQLLTPREVAKLFQVTVTTLALWSRTGRLPVAVKTPGGHRRFRRGDILPLLSARTEDETACSPMEEDAVRLYDQGWSIKLVAEKFDVSYGVMRRLLKRNGVKFRRSANG